MESSFPRRSQNGEAGQRVCHANHVSARLSELWHQSVQEWNQFAARPSSKWRGWSRRLNSPASQRSTARTLCREFFSALPPSPQTVGKAVSTLLVCNHATIFPTTPRSLLRLKWTLRFTDVPLRARSTTGPLGLQRTSSSLSRFRRYVAVSVMLRRAPLVPSHLRLM